jgi:hypothetical protein
LHIFFHFQLHLLYLFSLFLGFSVGFLWLVEFIPDFPEGDAIPDGVALSLALL